MAGGLRWTEEQLAEFQQRRKQTDRILNDLREARQSPASDSPRPSPALAADPGPERDLQAKCERYLREHGYPFIHDRSRGSNEAGAILDIIAALPGGRTVWLELKSKSGRLSNEQKLTIRMLLALGHEVYEIRSFKRFLEVVADRG